MTQWTLEFSEPPNAPQRFLIWKLIVTFVVSWFVLCVQFCLKADGSAPSFIGTWQQLSRCNKYIFHLLLCWTKSTQSVTEVSTTHAGSCYFPFILLDSCVFIVMWQSIRMYCTCTAALLSMFDLSSVFQITNELIRLFESRELLYTWTCVSAQLWSFYKVHICLLKFYFIAPFQFCTLFMILQ